MVGFGLRTGGVILSAPGSFSFSLLSFKLHPKLIAAILLQFLLGGKKEKRILNITDSIFRYKFFVTVWWPQTLKHESPMSMSGSCEEQEPCTIILEGGEKNEKPSFMSHQIHFSLRILSWFQLG